MGNNCWICGKENLHPDGIHTCSYRPEILELIEKAKAQAVAEYYKKLKDFASIKNVRYDWRHDTESAQVLLTYAESLLPKEEKETK